MVRLATYFVIAWIAAAVAAQAPAAELQRATADAWLLYMCGTGTRTQARLERSKPFLWIDESARRLRRGEIVVAPVVGCGTESVTGGSIHDWIGAVFIPNATIESLLNVVHDYDRYKDIYKPVVADSRSLEADGPEQEFSRVWQKHVLFLNATILGRYRAHDVTVDPHHGYSIVEATKLPQIDEYGRPGEHLLAPDTGSGPIWRIYSLARYEHRDGGVYLEIEDIALSRDIPISMRWLVNPMVNHLSVNC